MTQIKGGYYLPTIYQGTAPPTMTSVSAITGSTHKYAWVGRVSFEGSGTKDAQRVQFAFGAITKAGGSAMTLSFQDVDATTGQPLRPNGTQDETVAIANGDSGFVSNTWYRSGTFSANRTVSNGDLLAVVLEYDGSGRLGADSVAVRGLAISSNAVASQGLQDALLLYNGTTWAAANVANNILLEFSDGTFGALESVDHVPCSGAVTSYSCNTATVARDEVGFSYVPEFTHDIDGIWFVVAAAAAADYEVILYDGTTALLTVTVDATQTAATSARHLFIPISQTTLTSGGDYRGIIKPTTTTNITIYAMPVSDNAHLDVMSGGDNFMFTSRVDAGTWTTPSTTERVCGGVRACTVPNAGGGGGGVIPPFNGLLVTR